MPRDPYYDEPAPVVSPYDLTPEELAILGPPPQMQTETAPQMAPPGFLERFGVATQGMALPQPRGFGQGLVSGLLGGLSGQGQARAQAREKYTSAIEKRAQERAAANQHATDVYNLRQFQLRMKKMEAGPKTPAAIEEESFRQTRGRRRAEIETGETPAEKRAREAADRAAKAAERANDQAAASNLFRLTDDYGKDKAITGYNQARNAYIRGKAARERNDGVGDLALVFSMMRSLEPDNPNTTREGEVMTARDAVGLLQKYRSFANRYIKGDTFTEEGRVAILNLIKGNLRVMRPAFDDANKQFEERAKYVKTPPETFIRSFPSDTSFWADGSTESRVPTGFSVVAPDGLTYTFKSQKDLDGFKKDAGIK